MASHPRLMPVASFSLSRQGCDITFHCYRFLSRSDSVTVGVWNNRKVHKREGAGFLGCVRLGPTTITRLKDTGCEWFPSFLFAFTCNRSHFKFPMVNGMWSWFPSSLPADQRLNLTKNNPDDEEMIRGQLICESYLTPPQPIAD